MTKKMVLFAVLVSILCTGCSMFQTPQQIEETKEQERINRIYESTVIGKFTQDGDEYGMNSTWTIVGKKNNVTSLILKYEYNYSALMPMTFSADPENSEPPEFDESKAVEEYEKKLKENGFYDTHIEGVVETVDIEKVDDNLYKVVYTFKVNPTKTDFKELKELGHGAFLLNEYNSWEDISYISLYKTYSKIDNVKIKENFK